MTTRAFWIALVAALGASATAAPQEAVSDEPDRPVGMRPSDPPLTDPAFGEEAGANLRLFPAFDPYPPYIADPHRPGNAVLLQGYTRESVTDASKERIAMRAGGRFGLLRLSSGGPGSREWQLGVEAGFDAQFDSQYRLDCIGWDGNYGVTLTSASSGPFALKLGWLHTSAHVGDEYAQRTGRQRINYTREEAALGLSLRFGEVVRVYTEGGYGYHLRNEDVQKPWRAQAGLELQSHQTLWKGRLGVYFATDVQAMDENDWRVDTAVQAGIFSRAGGKVWRLGVQYTDGRVPLGEFYSLAEAWVTVGAWVDF